MTAGTAGPEEMAATRALAQALAARVEAAREAEVERTLRRLHHLDEADRRHVEELSRQIVRAVIAGPLQRLAGTTRHLEAARDLFKPV